MTDMVDYQDWIANRWNEQQQQHYRSINDRLAIVALGLGGEAGECQEHIKKFLRGTHDINRHALVLELGDCLHYLTRLGQEFGITLEEMAAYNIEKLNERAKKYAHENVNSVSQ